MAMPLGSFQNSSRFFPLTPQTGMATGAPHTGHLWVWQVLAKVCRNGATWGDIIPVLSCTTLLSKAGSNWLETIIASHLSLFWLISFLFLFHLHVCWKQKRGGGCHSGPWLSVLRLLVVRTPPAQTLVLRLDVVLSSFQDLITSPQRPTQQMPT